MSEYDLLCRRCRCEVTVKTRYEDLKASQEAGLFDCCGEAMQWKPGPVQVIMDWVEPEVVPELGVSGVPAVFSSKRDYRQALRERGFEETGGSEAKEKYRKMSERPERRVDVEGIRRRQPQVAERIMRGMS